ncbi:unnamed protein product, partial [Symbiodinium pilosum]
GCSDHFMQAGQRHRRFLDFGDSAGIGPAGSGTHAARHHRARRCGSLCQGPGEQRCKSYGPAVC